MQAHKSLPIYFVGCRIIRDAHVKKSIRVNFRACIAVLALNSISMACMDMNRCAFDSPMFGEDSTKLLQYARPSKAASGTN